MLVLLLLEYFHFAILVLAGLAGLVAPGKSAELVRLGKAFGLSAAHQKMVVGLPESKLVGLVGASGPSVEHSS